MYISCLCTLRSYRTTLCPTHCFMFDPVRPSRFLMFQHKQDAVEDRDVQTQRVAEEVEVKRELYPALLLYPGSPL